MAIRTDGDWESWLRFFLRGIAETAEEATKTAQSIVRMREEHRALIQEHRLGLNGLRLLDALYRVPLVNVTWVQGHIGVAYVTASKLLARFQEIGLVDETTGGKRFRRFRYTPYLLLFEENEIAIDPDVPIQITAASPHSS